MLVRHKKPFLKGFALLLSFFVMAAVMLTPIFRGVDGSRLTSLQYADAVFNSLSKGSSDFAQEVQAAIKTVAGQKVDLSIPFSSLRLSQMAERELAAAGTEKVMAMDEVVSFHGPLEPILAAAARDSAELFANNGKAVSDRYAGAPPLLVSEAWWHLLEPAVKELQKEGRVQTASVVDLVVKKAIEPANNFYGISDANVADNIFLIFAMLAFYVLYAIWYGFGIYNLFDGLGLMGGHAGTSGAAEN